MNLFGQFLLRKAADLITHLPMPLPPRGWYGVIRESFSGAWQRNITVDRADVLTYSTVWSCVTLIAGDIAKLWIQLTIRDKDGISTETENPSFSPVLRKPNRYQTRVKFIEYWMISKFTAGNTYVLKERNNRGGEKRGNVVALYILDPNRVKVLVAPDGAVYYQLSGDDLAGVDSEGVTVPASEIIHDICVPLYHPLVGVSPIVACWLSATTGIKIQQNSAKLFANGSNLSGVLTAPASISEDNAKRIQAHWDANFMGEANIGKVAVLGDGLKFEPMTMTALNAQLAEQLKMSDEKICSTFHIPGYMVGVGPPPPYNNIQALNLQYYSQALQNPIENLEVLLEEGLELPRSPEEFHIEMDLQALLRMDTATLTSVMKEQVGAGITSPNEARATFDRKGVKGGETPYLQEQNWPLRLLAARELPARPPTPPADLPPADPPTPPKGLELDTVKSVSGPLLRDALRKQAA